MKIPTPVAVAIIGLAILVIAGVGYFQYQQAANPPPVADSRPFRTEEGWTVLQVAQTVADLGAFSHKDKKLGTVTVRKTGSDRVGASVYDVKGERKKQTISLETGVWNPATYTAWAKDVFARADSAVPAFSSLEMAKTLLTPGFDVFFSENKRVSGFLTEHPASAAGQLQAALLAGTIALNDYSGRFKDVRIPLNRMTAYLAAADALGLPATDPGRQLAEAIRLTLCGQQAAALEAVKALGPDPALAEWATILRLRNTTDWRDGREAALKGSTAQRNEYFRALTHAIDAIPGIEFLKEAKVEPDAALWRIANETSLSVEAGHIFSDPGTIIPIELKEAAGAAEKFGLTVTKENPNWLKDYLDTPEGSPVTDGASGLEIQVAGRNLFAGYHQRHLLQAGQQSYDFLHDRWGVKDQAQELKDFLTGKLPDLRYTPFLKRMLARSDAERRAANPPCEVIIREHPEMVTPCLWASLRINENGEQVLGAPDFHRWFHPEVPQATAFDSGARMYDIGVGDESDPVWLKVLWERAPYSFDLAMQNAYLENHKSWEHMPGEIAAKWLGVQTDYDIRAMRRLALCYEDGQLDLYEAGMKKAAAIDPDMYLRMGAFFEYKGMDDKAATYYLEAFAKANNRVWMANNADWLVKYLFRKNDLPMATKVAEDAAEVYSYGGLEAYVWLMEAQGKWEKALETARKVDERYNGDGHASEIGCLIRYHLADSAAADTAGFQDKVGRIFPDSVQKVQLSDFSLPPKSGAVFTGYNDAMKTFGLPKGAVVVALDGYRIDTLAQYMAIRGISREPAMSFIIWDGAAYKAIDGRHAGRRFGVEMVDYVAK